MRSLSRLLVVLGVAGSAVGFAFVKPDVLDFGGSSADLPISSLARRGTLRIVVTERGNLQSTKTVDGICEVQGREIKIIELVPEGTEVVEGQVVCRFDTSEIDQNIAQQQIKVEQAESKIETTRQELAIQRNEAESKVQEATVEHELAEIDLEKYVEGDFPAEIKDLRGNIALARMEVERSAEKLEQFRELVKKGFRSPEQLRAVEQEYEQFKNYLERDELKLAVKEDFERRRMVTEYTSKVSQARSKVQRAKANQIAQVAKAESEHNSAKATFEVEKRQLDVYQQMREKCTIVAEQSGVVAYANEPWYDSSRQVREGAMVYFRQKIFSLPDMDSMQVSVNVHESMVKKVEAGQKAEIRIDAFPGLVLPGTVKSVAQLADSNRSWMSGGSKEYATVVSIDEMPDEDLRPDMTAEVRILARTIPDALIVPVSAVAAHKGEHYAFVLDDRGEIERRPVEIGDSNETHVQITSGLDEGERVAHDARSRLKEEFGDDGDEEAEEQPEPGPPASPGAAPA